MTERQQEILSHLDVRGAMSIRELAAVLFVSEASVRRDVALLEKAGALRRVHGGVLPTGVESVRSPAGSRWRAFRAEGAHRKPRGGNGARRRDDSSGRIEHRSANAEIPSRTERDSIITNNDRVFDELGACDAEVYCTGGRFNRENHAFVGPAAESFVRGISADMLFFSSQGISPFWRNQRQFRA